jgi:hypothetical protein
MSAFKV